MYSKCWQIIKDDSKRTFEVCGQAFNTNAFTNKTVALQRAGMNVSCATPPITNKTSSRELIKLTGYTYETGLLERLVKEYRAIMKGSMDDESF